MGDCFGDVVSLAGFSSKVCSDTGSPMLLDAPKDDKPGGNVMDSDRFLALAGVDIIDGEPLSVKGASFTA